MWGFNQSLLSVPCNLYCILCPSQKKNLLLPHICVSVGTAPKKTCPAGESLLHSDFTLGWERDSVDFLLAFSDF